MLRKPCLLCQTSVRYEETSKYDHGRCYHCPICGEYVADGELTRTDSPFDRNNGFRIACVFREYRERLGQGVWGVFSDSFKPGAEAIDSLPSRWWRLSELRKEFPEPWEMLDRALLNLSRRAGPMEKLKLPWTEGRYLFYLPEKGDIEPILDWMQEQKLIKREEDFPAGLTVRITPAGWQRIAELRRRVSDSTQGFVAMWFADETDDSWRNGIKPGIEDAGYKAFKISEKETNNKVCDEIIAEIRRSRFVVADFTAGQCQKCGECDHGGTCREKVRPRGGVYFEAGYAMGLGTPVIWAVHKNQVDFLHFDTNHYNHVMYGTPEDLRKGLSNRIRVTVGQGPVPPKEGE